MIQLYFDTTGSKASLAVGSGYSLLTVIYAYSSIKVFAALLLLRTVPRRKPNMQVSRNSTGAAR
eukprot:2278815-Pleurochrysis_carterae.AAC.6